MKTHPGKSLFVTMAATFGLLAALFIAQPAAAQGTAAPGRPTSRVPTSVEINKKIDAASYAFEAGRYTEAAKLFREVVKLDPKHALAWHFLGRSLAEDGDADGARQAFEKTLEIQPNGKVAERTREQLIKFPMRVLEGIASRPGAMSSDVTPFNWRMQGSFSSKSRQHAMTNSFASGLGSLTRGRGTAKVFPAGALAPPLGALEYVSRGSLDAAFVSPAFFYGKNSAFAVVDNPPFGLTADKYVMWRHSPNVVAQVDALYRAHGRVKAIFCSINGANGELWSRNPIRGVADFSGLKLRAVGLRKEVYEQIGAAVNALPGGEIVSALDRGLIDAGMFSDPDSDRLLDFPAVVSNYYYSGVFVPATPLDLIINEDRWQALSPDTRAKVEAACANNVRTYLQENPRVTTEALEKIRQLGVKVQPYPAPVLSALQKAWTDVAAKKSAESVEFRDLLGSMQRFR